MQNLLCYEITFIELYQPVIAASRVVDSGSRLMKLRKVLRELPPINFQTFQFLAQHLRHVVEHEQVNKVWQAGFINLLLVYHVLLRK